MVPCCCPNLGLCWYPLPPSCVQTLGNLFLCTQLPCSVLPDIGDSGSFLACAVFLGGVRGTWVVLVRTSWGRSLPSLGGIPSGGFRLSLSLVQALGLGGLVGRGKPASCRPLQWPHGPGQAWCPGYVVPTLLRSHCALPAFAYLLKHLLGAVLRILRQGHLLNGEMDRSQVRQC